MPKKLTNNDITRLHHQLNAAKQPGGRLASSIATLLMGKRKVGFRPEADKGDYVEVENVSKLSFSGKKMEQKLYYRVSGYPGGIKKTQLKFIFNDNPAKVLRLMVLRMLPKNKLRPAMIKRLTFKSEK